MMNDSDQYCEGCDKVTPMENLLPTQGGLYCPKCQDEKIEVTEDDYGLTFEYS